jgi:hypothetical protein
MIKLFHEYCYYRNHLKGQHSGQPHPMAAAILLGLEIHWQEGFVYESFMQGKRISNKEARRLLKRIESWNLKHRWLLLRKERPVRVVVAFATSACGHAHALPLPALGTHGVVRAKIRGRRRPSRCGSAGRRCRRERAISAHEATSNNDSDTGAATEAILRLGMYSVDMSLSSGT